MSGTSGKDPAALPLEWAVPRRSLLLPSGIHAEDFVDGGPADAGFLVDLADVDACLVSDPDEAVSLAGGPVSAALPLG